MYSQGRGLATGFAVDNWLAFVFILFRLQSILSDSQVVTFLLPPYFG